MSLVISCTSLITFVFEFLALAEMNKDILNIFVLNSLQIRSFSDELKCCVFTQTNKQETATHIYILDENLSKKQVT